jgi:hypothetical protein
LVLASLQATYEWYDPIDVEGDQAPWYGEVGVRNGVIVWGNHEPPSGGHSFRLRSPRVMPIPFYVGAGPEGGGVYLAAWIPPVLVLVALLLRQKRKLVP